MIYQPLENLRSKQDRFHIWEFNDPDTRGPVAVFTARKMTKYGVVFSSLFSNSDLLTITKPTNNHKTY